MKKRRGKEKNESCQESFSEWSSIHSSPSGRKGVFETDRDCRSSFSVFDTKVFVVRFECLQWKERMEMKKRQVVYQGILHSLAGGRVSFSRKEKTQGKNMCAEKGSQGKRGRGKEVLILPPTDTTIDQASFHDHLTVFIISRLICNRDLLFLSLLQFSSSILSLTLDHKTLCPSSASCVKGYPLSLWWWWWWSDLSGNWMTHPYSVGVLFPPSLFLL